MKEIPLTRGYVALVDDDDYEELSQHKWHVLVTKTRVYAVRSVKNREDKWRKVLMHRVIAGNPQGFDVDHIDHNGLNNCKTNLRVATRAENNRNSEKSPNPRTSRYKGVTLSTSKKRWKAQITYNNRCRFLGSYLSEEEAAKAYDKMALELFQDFACINFPEGLAA